MDSHICAICSESKDPTKTRFEPRRLGLNEPPWVGPVQVQRPEGDIRLDHKQGPVEDLSGVHCKRHDYAVVAVPQPRHGHGRGHQYESEQGGAGEARRRPGLSLIRKMQNGLFPYSTTRMITETGCTWWTGPALNVNAKVRKMSNGEAVVKVTRSR